MTTDRNYIETSKHKLLRHNHTGLKEDISLTFQVSDEGDRLDGIACVGKGLDDMVLHYTDHTKAWLVTWNANNNNNIKRIRVIHTENKSTENSYDHTGKMNT